MKRNFLRLCLTIGLLSLNSCRQDIILEHETYNNSGAFQLTSKRISLDEAKHKAKLLPELEKVEAKFKTFTKTNALGKVVDYGNGVSIDTDNVTYIENGPSYHTYTFNIIRNNALPTDPVENLVLTPLADGSYKELLVNYNLTPQQKNALMMGASVDTKGKTTVTELAKGIFNSGGQLARFNCGYQSTTIWVNCCHNGYHNPTNVDDWASCVCPPEGQPNVYTVVSYVCAPVYDTITPTDPGGSSGGGGGGGGNTPCTDCPPQTETPTEPCNGNGVLTGPFDPVLSPGDGGCGGVVTIPTLPTRNNPCEKTKAIVNKPQIQDSLISMKSFAQTSIRTERGFQELKSGTLLSGTVTEDLQVKLGIGPNSLGNIHVHPLKGIAMFSAGDIVTFLHLLREQDASTIGSAYAGMVSANGTYFINFTGTVSDIPPAMTEIQEKVYIAGLVTDYKDLCYILLKAEGKKTNQQLSNQGLEKLFNYLINTMGLNGKITLIKEENGNTSTIEFNPDGTPKTPNPC